MYLSPDHIGNEMRIHRNDLSYLDILEAKSSNGKARNMGLNDGIIGTCEEFVAFVGKVEPGVMICWRFKCEERSTTSTGSATIGVRSARCIQTYITI
jgi:hypothetical protein